MICFSVTFLSTWLLAFFLTSSTSVSTSSRLSINDFKAYITDNAWARNFLCTFTSSRVKPLKSLNLLIASGYSVNSLKESMIK